MKFFALKMAGGLNLKAEQFIYEQKLLLFLDLKKEISLVFQ